MCSSSTFWWVLIGKLSKYEFCITCVEEIWVTKLSEYV